MTPLDRIRAQLAVVTCPAPLALRFDAEAAPGGVRIVAVAEVPDSDDPAATCCPRFTVTIPEAADLARVAKAVAEVALVAVEHEQREHLRMGGQRIDDPHAHDRRVP